MAINGTMPVVALIGPTSELEDYPTHWAKWGKGGHRTAQTLLERNSIMPSRREAGMTVWVVEDQKKYRLDSDLNSWIEDFSGGGSTGNGNVIEETLSFVQFDDERQRAVTTVELDGKPADASLYVDGAKVSSGLVREMSPDRFVFYIGLQVAFTQAKAVIVKQNA